MSLPPSLAPGSALCCGGHCVGADASPEGWSDRYGICRERAQEARRNADTAATSDLRRSWLQVMRDWQALAAQAEAFARASPAKAQESAPRCACAALFAALGSWERSRI